MLRAVYAVLLPRLLVLSPLLLLHSGTRTRFVLFLYPISALLSRKETLPEWFREYVELPAVSTAIARSSGLFASREAVEASGEIAKTGRNHGGDGEGVRIARF